jgi:CHAT domain
MATGIPEYDELKLRVEPGSEGVYRVVAFGPDDSVAEGWFSAPFTKVELDNFILRVGLPRRKTRAYRSSRMEEARDFGAQLHQALLQGDVRDVYLGARRVADARQRGLRVTLYLTGVPELMEIPWEFLYERPSFLSQSIYTPVVRSLDLKGARTPRRVTLPLRVLGVVSSPRGVESLDAAEERRKLEQALDALRSRGMVHLHWLERATLGELDRTIGDPAEEHVLHYIGHGAYDERTEGGILVLESAQGGAHEVTGEELCSVLHDERSLRLAVLNSCEGARTSHVDPFSGVASSLVECGIPAVIGMQFEITDDAAITFSERLYTALAQGYPVDAALAQGRKAIFAGGHDIEFGTPVLFLRGSDARLFDVEPSSGNGGRQQRAAAPTLRRVKPRPVIAGAVALVVLALIVLGALLGGSGDGDPDGQPVVTGPQATSLLERFTTRFSDGDVDGVSAVLGSTLEAHAVANPTLGKADAVSEMRPTIESGAQLELFGPEARILRDERTVVDARYGLSSPGEAPEELGDATFEVGRDGDAIVITKLGVFPDLVWGMAPPDLSDFKAAAREGETVVARFDADPDIADDLRMTLTAAGRRTLRDGADVTFASSGFTAAGREVRERLTVTYQRFRLFGPTLIDEGGS